MAGAPAREGLGVMGWGRGALIEPARAVQPATVLQVQEAKVVAPQQLEPQPVRALVRAALGLMAAQRGKGDPRRQRPLRQPGRELAGEVDAGEAIAGRLVALRRVAGEVACQVSERRPLATGELGLPPREGGVGVGMGVGAIANRQRLRRTRRPVGVAQATIIGRREPASA